MRILFAIMAVALLAACSPQEQKLATDIQQHSVFEEDALIAADGARLPFRHWLPSDKKYTKKPKAVLIALHGFNDYGRAFEGVGAYMQKKQIATFAYDQRGFGETQQIGIWAGQQNLTRDLKEAVLAAGARYPDAPIFILGESMGGAVTIAAVTEPDFPAVHGIILSAPAVWGSAGMNPLFRGTLWLMAHIIPGKEFTGSDLKVLASNNLPMLRRMSMDPLVIKKTRLDAMYGVVGLMGVAYDRVPEVKVPVLLMYGAHDQVIPSGPVNEVINRFNRPITFAYYDWAYHMLLRDLQSMIAHRDVASWILRPGVALPSGVAKQVDPAEDRKALLMDLPQP